MIVLLAIHGYLVPTNKSVKKDVSGKTNIIKYTIKDSQESFLYSQQQIEEHLRFLNYKKKHQYNHLTYVSVKIIYSIPQIYQYISMALGTAFFISLGLIYVLKLYICSILIFHDNRKCFGHL